MIQEDKDEDFSSITKHLQDMPIVRTSQVQVSDFSKIQIPEPEINDGFNEPEPII